MDVTLLLSAILNISDPKAKNVVLGVMEASHKIKALKAIAFAKKPSDDWYDRISDVLKDIDDKIRPERNRMIHDTWMSVPPGASRISIAPKVVNEQARRKKLQLAEFKDVMPADITDLCKKIEKCSVKLIDLRAEFERLSSP